MHLRFNRKLCNLISERFDSADYCREISWLQTARIVQHQNMFVFERFKPDREIQPQIGDDDIGLECFLNKFHFRGESVEHCVAMAIYIFTQIGAIWENSFGSDGGKICQIVSIEPCANEKGYIDGSYRFHYVRDNQSWLAEDLDGYEMQIVLVSD